MQNILTILLILSLTACTTTPALKAPCNYSGSNCGPKIKINQWNNA